MSCRDLADAVAHDGRWPDTAGAPLRRDGALGRDDGWEADVNCLCECEMENPCTSGRASLFQAEDEGRTDRDVYHYELLRIDMAEMLGFASIWNVQPHSQGTRCAPMYRSI